MRKNVLRTLLVFVLIVTLLIPPPPASACGPYFPDTIFIQIKHPDVPLSTFATGRLGVIQPTYARSYLVVAYRYLTGIPFDRSEQRQLLALWAHRLGKETEWLGGREQDGYEKWLETRNKFTRGAKPEPANSDSGRFAGYGLAPSGYFEYDNCAEDAFLTATKTLEALAKRFGRDSREVQDWLTAQDTVFRNCSGSASTDTKFNLPTEPAAQLPALLRYDREYQIAAAYFYQRNWAQAEQRFQMISQDRSSPWRAIAALVALRVRLREITLSEDFQKSSKKELAALDSDLRDLEKMPSMHEVRPAIWRMRGFVEFRLDPNRRRVELANAIEHATRRSTLRQDLDDYTQLLDRATGDDPDEDFSNKPKIPVNQSYGKLEVARRRNEMTDWILTFQATSEAAAAHALGEWNKLHSLPWLVTCLSKATPNTPGISALLQAAAVIQPDSPAYLTVTFHLARLQAQSGDERAAIQTIEKSTAAIPAGLLSAKNLFLALHMNLARSLDEFLQLASRHASAVTDGGDGFDLSDNFDWCEFGNARAQAGCQARRSPPPLFDSDAATILTEGLPTRLLVQASSSPRLPENLRRQVAQSAWVRAILLNDEATARELVPLLSALSPELAPALKSYEQSSDTIRRFEAVFLILHHPELHPYVSAGVGRETPPGRMDSFHDNWWCSFSAPANPDRWGNYYAMYTHINGPLLGIYADKKLEFPSFLNDSERMAAEKEWATLSQLEGAPDWLGSQVLAFAKSNPKDSRVPEALHYLVRAGHLGCTDVDSEHYSKTAFRLLHTRYRDSSWAKKTPYWYN